MFYSIKSLILWPWRNGKSIICVMDLRFSGLRLIVQAQLRGKLNPRERTQRKIWKNKRWADQLNAMLNVLKTCLSHTGISRRGLFELLNVCQYNSIALPLQTLDQGSRSKRDPFPIFKKGFYPIVHWEF